MEWNEVGIKNSDDVLVCMCMGATARELYEAYGERIAGLIADALDRLYEVKIR